MIYTCLFDAAGTVDLSLDGNQMNWDDFGSSSLKQLMWQTLHFLPNTVRLRLHKRP